MPVLKAISIAKSFGSYEALKDVSFELQKGEILGLLGPNGAGKTTTLHILLGLTTPSSGSIEILDKELTAHKYSILPRVNFASAYVTLPDNLTVIENLTTMARLYNVPRRAEKIATLAELFQITELLKKLTGVLSAGQRTRVNLCKALLNDPEILFLDEPTASLDPDIAEKIRELLLSVRKTKGVSMIYTSHNMREVELICDRVLFLSRGKIILEGPPQEVVKRAQSSSLEQLFIAIARGGDLRDSEEKRV